MSKKRRGNGEGSIYQRKDGLWVGQYKIETTKGPKTKYLYSKSRKDVARRLANFIAERDSGIIFDSESLTLGAYLDRWLNSIEDTIRAGTFRRYEEATRIHIKPNLGNERLDKVNAFELQSLYRVKLDSDLSPRSVQIIHATLHKALKQAVKWQLLSRNVAQSVNPPKAQNKDINPLDEEQVKRLLKAVEGDRLEPLYILAITTGMRLGELLGLKWEDLDLEARTLQVKRTVSNGRIEAPKTSKSRRSIKLTKTSVQSLSEYPRMGEWIFSTSVGTP